MKQTTSDENDRLPVLNFEVGIFCRDKSLRQKRKLRIYSVLGVFSRWTLRTIKKVRRHAGASTALTRSLPRDVYIRRKNDHPVAKDVYIRPTSISFLPICQSPATDVVVVACLRGVFFVSSLIAACSLGPCSLRK